MYPTQTIIRQLAATGKYRRIPVCRELYSDRYTPVEVMRTLRKVSRHCYLLESAGQTEVWGRYSFLGFRPTMESTCTDGTMKISSTSPDGEKETIRQVTHPGDTLREILDQYKSPMIDGMPPFTGGLVGYFSYDYIRYSEPKLKLEEHEEPDFRDMDLMLFDQVIAFDHYRQKILLITGVMTDDLENSLKKAEQTLDELAELIKFGPKKEFKPIKLQSEIQPQFPKEKYCQMVETARHYIREGDIFQVVLSNPMRAKAEGSLFDTYRVLRATNPSPYMFYFTSDDIEIAGASPETLVKLENGKLSTFPLAGTRPRGKTRSEDLELEADLLKDEKELAEHNMLVDLGRNDIGKISKIGSVEVEKYLEVYQLVGSVEPDIRVVRNDEYTVEEIENMHPDAQMISPGPGRPDNAGICVEAIRYFAGKLPILGVCLGHQSICEAFGATVSYAKELMHGKQKMIYKVGESRLFDGLKEGFPAARYHSLAAVRDTLPEVLRVTAESEDGEVMAVEHTV